MLNATYRIPNSHSRKPSCNISTQDSHTPAAIEAIVGLAVFGLGFLAYIMQVGSLERIRFAILLLLVFEVIYYIYIYIYIYI